MKKPVRDILADFTFREWIDVLEFFTQTQEGYQYCVKEAIGLFSLEKKVNNDIYPILEYLKSRYSISEFVSWKNNFGQEQYFVEIRNGSNGRFGNCTFDINEIKEILEYLNYGPEKGIIDWANLYLYSGDMADDVYSWVITFTHV